MPRVQIALPERFDFVVDLPVRLADLNYGNHLSNDRVLNLIHEARFAWLASLGLTELDLGEGIGLIQVDAAVQYRAQAHWGDVLQIELAVVEPKATGFRQIYRIRQASRGVEVARVEAGFAYFDYARQRVTRGPDTFLRRWLQ